MEVLGLPFEATFLSCLFPYKGKGGRFIWEVTMAYGSLEISVTWLISCGTFGMSFSLTKPLVQEELEQLERMGSASASCNE